MKFQRRRRWIVFGLSLGIVLTGVVSIFYAYVNWQGEKQWSALVNELREKGEPTGWQDVIPPPIPDAQNFCATPLFSSLFNYTLTPGSRERSYADPITVKKVENLRFNDPGFPNFPSNGSRTLNRMTDLKPWQEYYQKSKYFPHPPAASKPSPAISILVALNLYRKELDELREASRRPEARAAIHYDEEPKYSLSFPHLGPTINISNLLSLRARAYLQEKQPSQAWMDLQVILKFQQALRKEPTLISNLVGITEIGVMLGSIWDGLALEAWTEAELRDISKRLSELDFLTDCRLCLKRETVFYRLSMLDAYKDKTDMSGNFITESLSMDSRWGRLPYCFPGGSTTWPR